MHLKKQFFFFLFFMLVAYDFHSELLKSMSKRPDNFSLMHGFIYNAGLKDKATLNDSASTMEDLLK